MDRSQKAEFVEKFHAEIAAAPLVVLADYRGASANETNAIRRTLEKAGIELQVIKNSLAKRALVDTDKCELSEHFVGMTAVIVSGEDAIATAKAVKAALGPKSPIQVKGGFFEGEVLDAAGINAVAALPSREELLSLLLRTLQAGPRQVMGVIRAPARDLLYLLKNYEQKLADADGGE